MCVCLLVHIASNGAGSSDRAFRRAGSGHTDLGPCLHWSLLWVSCQTFGSPGSLICEMKITMVQVPWLLRR